MSSTKITLRQFAVIGIIALLYSNYLFAHSNSLFDESLKKGTSFLKKQMPDSAISCFVKAYSEGLSKDSLLYFWSEALMAKGILDSALAANYIASNTHSIQLRINVLKQRCLIFNKLGWNSETQRIIDTIYSFPQFRRRHLIPVLDIGFSSGFNKEQQVTDTVSPWKDSANALPRTVDAYYGSVNVRSTWEILRRQKSLNWGLGGSASRRFNNTLKINNSFDSISTAGELFIKTSGKNFFYTYTLSINHQSNDSLLFGNSIEGGLVGNGAFSPFFLLGSTVDINANGKFADSKTWFFTSLQKKIYNNYRLNFNCLVNAKLAKKFEFEFTDSKGTLYAQDARLQYPIFYEDASYSKVIDTSRFYSSLSDDIKRSSMDSSSITISFKQPLSNISVTPKTSFAMKCLIPLEIGLGWNFNYYFEPYEWDQLSLDYQYLVYSLADNRYYTIPNDKVLRITRKNGGLAIDPSVEQIIHHSLIRFDNSAILNLTLQFYHGKVGVVTMQTLVSKTWSTMSKQAPIYIPEWAFNISLTWKFKFKNNLNCF